MNLIIKNGYVFDPMNGIDGEKMDIFVKDGKIVEELSPNEMKDAKVIDASNKTVMPGGVDSHTHVAGAKVTHGRLLCPEYQYKHPIKKTDITHSGSGKVLPSSYVMGYKYALMGYTTICEAATPPMLARHTHEELKHVPIVNKCAYLMFGNNWFVMKYLKEGDIEKTAAYVAWMNRIHKTYGIKIVNPAGVENWGWGLNIYSLDEPNLHFEITPREIIRGLAEVNEILGYPMSIHVHANGLGHPGNWEITKETLKIPEDIKANPKVEVNEEIKTKVPYEREQSIYLTHVQFNAFGGTSWKDFESGTREIIDYVNKSKHVVIDSGCVIFGPAICMTGDGPNLYDLAVLAGGKWSNADVELECGSGIVPFTYKKKNGVHSVQWAMGLELLLGVKDPWKVIMTTDSPNGGSFTNYPKVISWLMSKKAMEDMLKECHKWASERTDLPNMDREYTLYEIATVTRATPAKAVGLAPMKGHLGVGADADIAIYDINPETLNTNDYKAIEKAFANAEYTINGGVIVAHRGEIVSTPDGKTYYCNAKFPDEEIYNEMIKDVKEWFKYYTFDFTNYPTTHHYLTKPTPINVGE